MKQKLKKIIGIVLSIGIGVFIIWWSVRGLTDAQLLDIKNAIVKAHTLNASKTNISATAFEIALKQLV